MEITIANLLNVLASVLLTRDPDRNGDVVKVLKNAAQVARTKRNVQASLSDATDFIQRLVVEGREATPEEIAEIDESIQSLLGRAESADIPSE